MSLLTGQDKADLTACAEDILLARESHFLAIVNLYDPDTMPDTMPHNLHHAHERNDERIYTAAASRTIPSGWKSCSSCTPR
jgi:hypothetical protein